MKTRYFVKSFEEDFVLKRVNGKKKVAFQSIENIIKTKKIKPNTKSFGKEDRLACSFLHENYLKTYRARGIIFKTKERPDQVYPFDIVLLTDAEKIIVQYYRIKNDLHVYYNHKLIPGFEKFVFRDIDKLLKKINSPKQSWREVNKFRISNGYAQLPKTKYRLVEYAEVIFNSPIKIEPVAIFGYRKEARKIAKKLGLPHFVTAEKFYRSLEK